MCCNWTPEGAPLLLMLLTRTLLWQRSLHSNENFNLHILITFILNLNNTKERGTIISGKTWCLSLKLINMVAQYCRRACSWLHWMPFFFLLNFYISMTYFVIYDAPSRLVGLICRKSYQLSWDEEVNRGMKTALVALVCEDHNQQILLLSLPPRWVTFSGWTRL